MCARNFSRGIYRTSSYHQRGKIPSGKKDDGSGGQTGNLSETNLHGTSYLPEDLKKGECVSLQRKKSEN